MKLPELKEISIGLVNNLGGTMDKISQKEIVFSAIIETLKDESILFEVGETNFRDILNPKLKKLIHFKVLDSFITNKVPVIDTKSEKELAEYAHSVVNNWLLRDDRLNGFMYIINKSNTKYPNDKLIIALQNLLKETTDPTHKSELVKFIEERVAFLDSQTNLKNKR